jgi:nucleoside-diphosphate-sugar epimerase
MYDIDYFIFRPFNNFGERQNEGTYAGVIPLSITRLLKGEQPLIYGDGEQTREFIYVKDTADAVVRLSKDPQSRKQIVHVARGEEVKIRYLVELICKLMGYNGSIQYLPPRPNNVRRHLADVTKLKTFLLHPFRTLRNIAASIQLRSAKEFQLSFLGYISGVLLLLSSDKHDRMKRIAESLMGYQLCLQ